MKKQSAPFSRKIWLPLFLVAAVLSLLIGLRAEQFEPLQGLALTMKAFGALLAVAVVVQLARRWR